VPEVTYRTAMNVPVDEAWSFICDMNNWAPMLTGYQRHEIEDERRSIWTLKGDVGILSRTVRLGVTITEWNGPSRVSFTLKGLNEMVEGDGTFEMTPGATDSIGATQSGATHSGATPSIGATHSGATHSIGATPSIGATDTACAKALALPVPRGGLLARILARLARFFFRRKYGVVGRSSPAGGRPGVGSVLTFRLRMEAGGPTGPLVNAMLEPALQPATEHLANRIAEHLESRGSRRTTGGTAGAFETAGAAAR
jgi:carbon monoxide dehydrogenase subunit G